MINAAQATVKTVSDPNASYESLKPLWSRCKAVCSGERFVKDLDSVVGINNMLIPFSPSMSQAQYDFYKAEAELPGICAQFAKMLVGGLLRKSPSVTLPTNVSIDSNDWILNNFGQDDCSLTSFLDSILYEEIRSSRCWVYVDHPSMDEDTLSNLTKEERDLIKPFPVKWDAEFVINWQVSNDGNGNSILSKVITRGFVEKYTEKNEFHPEQVDTVVVHELIDGKYQQRIYEKESPSVDVPVVSGAKISNLEKSTFKLVDTITNILVNNERLTFIPAWPLNGSIEAMEPILSSIIDKEISLYNKISRRNHLLYGASTYTPVITSDMTDEDFQTIVGGGLGSWIKLRQGDTATVLETPTSALQDMDRAISSSIEEMAKLGIRMLSPESAQSGVALQLRNAAQTAQLGSLNQKVSSTMRQIIAFMLEWRYGEAISVSDVNFSLSDDFSPIPLGADWLRLATEWYQGGLIPRSIWLQILKQNDIVAPDYNDEEGVKEINEDELLMAKANEQYAKSTMEDNNNA